MSTSHSTLFWQKKKFTEENLRFQHFCTDINRTNCPICLRLSIFRKLFSKLQDWIVSFFCTQIPSTRFFCEKTSFVEFHPKCIRYDFFCFNRSPHTSLFYILKILPKLNTAYNLKNWLEIKFPPNEAIVLSFRPSKTKMTKRLLSQTTPDTPCEIGLLNVKFSEQGKRVRKSIVLNNFFPNVSIIIKNQKKTIISTHPHKQCIRKITKLAHHSQPSILDTSLI